MIDCIQLTEPGKTTVICAVRLKLRPDTIRCILNTETIINNCEYFFLLLLLLLVFIKIDILIAGNDLSNIILTASVYGSSADYQLAISGFIESKRLEVETIFHVSISKFHYSPGLSA